jgi:replicative DNA helicase
LAGKHMCDLSSCPHIAIPESFRFAKNSNSRRISALPIYLNECATPSLSYFESECRKIAATERRELGLVVVDYLQLMGDGDSNRNNEISAITRGLKRLAMKLSVPIICLSQLSQAVETRLSKRPILSDLRDSGGIEQDGDKVIMLYRDEYYNLDSSERGYL